MRVPHRGITVAGAVLAGLVAVTGCSGGGSKTASPSAAAPTSSKASAPTTKAAAKAPDPNATESNPPGDIPDNQVFVAYTPPGATFHVKVPEGWARSTGGGAVTFTDKLNSIRMETVAAPGAPTVASAQQREVPAIAAATAKFAAGKVTEVSRRAGHAVLITYQADSQPDPVTNKVVRDAVERYEFWRGGKEVVLTLTGPKNADNVDPWRIVSDSFGWR
jgi:hypothetical protein